MRAQPIAEACLHVQQRVRAGAWIGIAALLFCAATTLTIAICTSMSSKGGMPMPGGWTMSMAWARLCGQTWPGAAASFIAMWSAMTVAMMLPALMPALARCRAVAMAGQGAARAEWFALLAGSGYFMAWIALGVALYPMGAALASLALRVSLLSRAVPFMAGSIMLMAGAFQLSTSKARYLACCRAAALPQTFAQRPGASAAWQYGLRLGWHCIGCCAGLTAMLLVAGIMDLRAMAFTVAAIGGERFARNGGRVARIIGACLVAAGGVLLAKACMFV
jgi:predicted metal-binding membrane protein